MDTLLVSTKKFTYQEFAPFFNGPVKVSLTKKSESNIKSSYRNLSSLLEQEKTIYGVNTGFGKLSNISISAVDQRQLQIK